MPERPERATGNEGITGIRLSQRMEKSRTTTQRKKEKGQGEFSSLPLHKQTKPTINLRFFPLFQQLLQSAQAQQQPLPLQFQLQLLQQLLLQAQQQAEVRQLEL